MTDLTNRDALNPDQATTREGTHDAGHRAPSPSEVGANAASSDKPADVTTPEADNTVEQPIVDGDALPAPGDVAGDETDGVIGGDAGDDEDAAGDDEDAVGEEE